MKPCPNGRSRREDSGKNNRSVRPDQTGFAKKTSLRLSKTLNKYDRPSFLCYLLEKQVLKICPIGRSQSAVALSLSEYAVWLAKVAISLTWLRLLILAMTSLPDLTNSISRVWDTLPKGFGLLFPQVGIVFQAFGFLFHRFGVVFTQVRGCISDGWACYFLSFGVVWNCMFKILG